MPSPTINFHSIRPYHGSQHGGFEELVCQLAALETAHTLPFHRKGAGADAGLECYRVEADGTETGWQAKYFFEFGSNEASQLTKSFNQAIASHPQLSRFIVSLPFNLSDGRVGKRVSERDRWNRWLQARTESIAPRISAFSSSIMRGLPRPPRDRRNCSRMWANNTVPVRCIRPSGQEGQEKITQ